MKTAITTTHTNPADLARLNDTMHQAGQVANKAAARRTFADHTARKADNTIRRKLADLALFESFLQSAEIPAADLAHNPQAWCDLGNCQSLCRMDVTERLCNRQH